MLVYFTVSFIWLTLLLAAIYWVLCSLDLPNLDKTKIVRCRLTSTPRDPFLLESQTPPLRPAFSADVSATHEVIQKTSRSLFSDLRDAALECNYRRCEEVVDLLSDLIGRTRDGFDGNRAAQTSGMVLFTNVLMEFSGLDILRQVSESGVSKATKIIETCVPIIWPL